MEQNVTTPVTKGLLLSLVIIVFVLIIQFSGQVMNRGLGSIQYLLLLGGIIWGCIVYANQMQNNVTFGNLFVHGFKMTAVVTVLMIVYSVIAVKLIFPDMVNVAVEQATVEMERRNMPEDQRGKAIEVTRKFFFPLMIGGILFIYMIVGVIASLIGAAVAKKNPPTPFAQANH